MEVILEYKFPPPIWVNYRPTFGEINYHLNGDCNSNYALVSVERNISRQITDIKH